MIWQCSLCRQFRNISYGSIWFICDISSLECGNSETWHLKILFNSTFLARHNIFFLKVHKPDSCSARERVKFFYYSLRALAPIVTCIWLSLCACPRRLAACKRASSDLVYRDHMARKQGLKDTTSGTIFDGFPMILAQVYSFLLWNWHTGGTRARTEGWATERERAN